MDSTAIFDRTRPAFFAPWTGLAVAVVCQAAVRSRNLSSSRAAICSMAVV